nr:hypothetical protein GCM10025732_07740 [Glycomyces mayteni]
MDKSVEKLWISAEICGKPVDRVWITGGSAILIRFEAVENPVHNLWKSCGQPCGWNVENSAGVGGCG